jgi:hypothetical protein
MINLYDSIKKINKTITANTLALNQMDQAIGDGDFGSNITLAFNLLMQNESK